MPGWLNREDRASATGTMLDAVLAALARPDTLTIPPRRPFIVAIRDVDQWPQDRLATLFQWAPTVGIRIIVTTRFDRLGRTAQAVPAAGQFESTLIFRPGSHHQAEMAAQWLEMDDPHAADRLRSMDRGPLRDHARRRDPLRLADAHRLSRCQSCAADRPLRWPR
uniref:Uncharacterized protein n=1 Tax=Burkholderia sp. M701 TaxID=326454 RepID=V5YP67_9BURK|nr:hypothetical protein [Burkholderia sp. M701]